MWMVAFGGVILNSQVCGVICSKKFTPILGVSWSNLMSIFFRWVDSTTNQEAPEVGPYGHWWHCGRQQRVSWRDFFSNAWTNAKSGCNKQIDTVDGRNPIPNHLECTNLVNHGINYVPIGAGFIPPTVSLLTLEKEDYYKINDHVCTNLPFFLGGSRFVLVRCWVSVLF